MRVRQALKNLDAFPRAEEHLLQKTQSGALVSVVGLLIMATLFVHELRYYLTTNTVHQMSVDLKRGETLPIHINMTFPALPCDVLSVDAIDMSGKHEVDLDTNIWKLRLNSHGHIIGTEYLSDLVEKEHSHKHDDGNDNHDDKDQEIHSQGTFDQAAEDLIKRVKHAIANGEGCRVFGVLDVQRVAGNFHISVHGLNIFVAQMIFGGSKNVNVSHIIHDLSFGPKYPGIHNPLDGTDRILHDTSGTFKYYIKIVPTEYKYISKEVLSTNQFSVTEYFSPMKQFDRSWPAVYFLYDLSPITVTIKEERRSFLHFITRLCAVLGGTFALTGMLDRWMYRFVENHQHLDLHPTVGAGAPVGVDDAPLLAAEAVAVLAGTDYVNLPSTVAVVVAGIGVDIALLAVATAGAVAVAAAVVVHADAVHC
ncbi:endoplasmic reticulum-Golgi intermediate compartment protein 3-like [Pyrus ussuriensis x Pyrus communis]|uniref:Endoplasmic reticulum-Golgi intermediate compartment protein 3-like n=1 Tax=Pyrus ussuriensis x Pyrus communis TaxID=2448454 RepID=A0A5N5GJE3_9ROSA|nr:endoplasmic reticulum-Golgi intermediate compartment protein 3-like [Pyrus ussuriensis x Pyrus communis]